MRTPPAGRLVDESGFTQAELVMVMVVLVLLAGLAVPSLRGLEGSRRDTATTRVRSALVHAQMWALDVGLHTWVAFDPAGDLLEAFVEDRSNPGRLGRLTLPDPLTRGPLVLDFGQAGVGIDTVDIGGTREVMFGVDGSPYDSNAVPLGSDGLITLSGGGIIRITKNTGLIRIE